MKKIFTIGLLLFGLYAVTGKAAEAVLNNVMVAFKNITLAAGATLLDIIQGSQPIILTLEITNTQQYGTTVNSFTGTAYMNGQPVGDVDHVFNIKLKPGVPTLIDIPITLNSEEVILAAGAGIQTKTIPPVNIQGTLNALSFNYPVNETISFDI